MRVILLLICFLAQTIFVFGQENNINTSLLAAIKANKHATVDSLLKVGADPNYQTTPNASTPAMWATYESDLDMVKILVKHGADVRKKGLLPIPRLNSNLIYGSVLTAAAGEGQSGIVTYLLDSLKLDVNEPELTPDGTLGMTAIMRACEWGKKKVILDLISHNAKVNQAFQEQNSLFFLLKSNSISGNYKDEILSETIQFFDLNLKDKEGKTIFHYLKFNFGIISKLDELGVRISENQDVYGNTPLHYILEAKNYVLAKSLIDKGYNVKIKNKKGRYALENILDPEFRLLFESNKTNKDDFQNWEYLTMRAYYEVSKKIENNFINLLNSAKSKFTPSLPDIDYSYYSIIDNINILMDDHLAIPSSNASVDSVFNLCKNLSQHDKLIYYRNKAICNYYCLNETSKADSLLQIVSVKTIDLCGKHSLDMAEILDLRSALYQATDNLPLAIEIQLDIEKLITDLQSDQEYLLSPSAFNLAQFYAINEQLDLSLEKASKAIYAIKKQKSKTLLYRYFQFLDLNGQSYLSNGDFKKSEQNYKKIENEFLTYFPDTDYSYPLYLLSYAVLLDRIGNLTDAEKYFHRAIDLQLKSNGKSENLPAFYINLGNFYSNIGDYSAASEVFGKVDESIVVSVPSIQKKILGNKFKQYYTAENSQSDTLLKTIFEKWPTSSFPFTLIQNRSNFEYNRNNKAKSDSLLNIVLEGYEKLKLNNDDYFYARLRRLALFVEFDKSQQANDYLIESERMFNISTFPIEKQINFNIEKLNVFRSLNKTEVFDSLTNEILEKLPLKYANATYAMSQNLTINFLNSEKQLNDYVFSLLEIEKFLKTSTILKLYNFIGLLNTYALRNFENAKNKIKISSDNNQVIKYRQLKNAFDEKNKASLSLSDKKTKEENWLKLNKELLWESISNSDKITDLNFNAVHLNTNELYIEFINFNKINHIGASGKVVFYALIFDSGKITHQKLFDESELVTLLKEFENEDFKQSNYLYSNKNSNKIYALIFKNLEKYFKNKDKLYLKPSGLLNRISFKALALDKNSLLSDKFNIEILSSRQNLYFPKITSIKNVDLFGDINYDLEENSNTEIPKADISVFVNNNTKRGEKWGQLAGSALEIREIGKILESKKISQRTFSKANAKEETVKEIGNFGDSPSIIHFATHGFSKNAETETKKMNSNYYFDEKLNNSGLILTGANQSWSNNKPIFRNEDGILTALEISNLDLSNTKLVVMSACQTALGEIKGNEGVFGLQRAFKMAGVEYTIASLWKVPDAETAEMMILFYKNLSENQDIVTAFNTAQKAMRKKYSPYYWAGFVLMR
jgi:CHAT domain-containing protein